MGAGGHSEVDKHVPLLYEQPAHIPARDKLHHQVQILVVLEGIVQTHYPVAIDVVGHDVALLPVRRLFQLPAHLHLVQQLHGIHLPVHFAAYLWTFMKQTIKWVDRVRSGASTCPLTLLCTCGFSGTGHL